MSLQLAEVSPGQLEVRQPDGRPLFRYVYQPDVPERESPRPYMHPLYSVDGDALTNFRPNDHPWHHGLSLTVTSIDGLNFWGGPSYRRGEGYQWRQDHGVQQHREWRSQKGDHLEHVLDWRGVQAAQPHVQEVRSMRVSLVEDGWSLAWRSALQNVSGRPLTCHNYHSIGGLEGSHYTGLQFRGARALLDEHGDDTIGIRGEDGVKNDAAHGQRSRWLEWHTQHDTTLRRTKVRFESAEPVYWFLRRSLPLVSFAFHRDEAFVLEPDTTLVLEQRLTFTRM